METVIDSPGGLAGVEIGPPGFFIGGREDGLFLHIQCPALLRSQKPGAHPDPHTADSQGRGYAPTVSDTAGGQDRCGRGRIDGWGHRAMEPILPV